MRIFSIIPPESLAIAAAITAILISENLNTEETDVVGNFLVSVGSIMVTISAQETLLKTEQSMKDQNEILKKQVELLKKQIECHYDKH